MQYILLVSNTDWQRRERQTGLYFNSLAVKIARMLFAFFEASSMIWKSMQVVLSPVQWKFVRWYPEEIF